MTSVQILRSFVVAVLLCICWGAHLRGSRRLDDVDGGFNDHPASDKLDEMHPDQEITLDQEGSLDQVEKLEYLIHSEKVNKLLEKAKTEVEAYSKDFAQESALDRLEKVIETEKNSPQESPEDSKTLGQLENLITKEIQAKKNEALATTSDSSDMHHKEEEEEITLDNLESLLDKEATRVQREEESFSGTSHTDIEQSLFLGGNKKSKSNIVTPVEELDNEKTTIREEDSASSDIPAPETDRENINLEEHVEENQYKWLKKKLGKKSRSKKLNGDEVNENFNSKLDEAGSQDKMIEMESGSYEGESKKKKKKRKSRHTEK